MLVVTLVDDPERGYIALEEKEGGGIRNRRMPQFAGTTLSHLVRAR
jgi:hypothetical protein